MSRHRHRSCRGKRRYRDREEALRCLRILEVRSTRGTIPFRAYPCQRCQGWHLSSQPELSSSSREYRP